MTVAPLLPGGTGEGIKFDIPSVEPLGPMGASGVGWEKVVQGGKLRELLWFVCACLCGVLCAVCVWRASGPENF